MCQKVVGTLGPGYVFQFSKKLIHNVGFAPGAPVPAPLEASELILKVISSCAIKHEIML